MCVHPCLPALQAALPTDPGPARGCAVHRLCWHRARPRGSCCIMPLSCLPGAELTAARQLAAPHFGKTEQPEETSHRAASALGPAVSLWLLAGSRGREGTTLELGVTVLGGGIRTLCSGIQAVWSLGPG